MNISNEDAKQYAAWLQASPKLREVIEASGLTTEQFAGTGDRLLDAMMAQGAVEAGQLKEIPEGIDAADVEFVKRHHCERACYFARNS